MLRRLVFAAFAMLLISCSRPDETADVTAEIVGLERACLDLWGKGDPQGFLDTFAPEMTYFDPAGEKRIDGYEAMRDYLAPLKGKFKVTRYEMISPKVQRHGPTGLLTFNLVSYGTAPNGAEVVLT